MKNVPNVPKTKSKAKKVGLAEVITTVGPFANDIATYGIHGLGAFGAGVYSYGAYRAGKAYRDNTKNLKKFMGRGREK